MQRKQFTFYRSFWESIENLKTDKEKLQSYQMLCAFALDGIEPDLTTKKPTAATVYQIAKPILETAHRRAQKMLTVNNLSQVP